MKYLILISTFIFTGCAVNKAPVSTLKMDTKPPEKVVVIDEECSTMAKYVRSVAMMRDIGVSVNDIPFILTEYPSGLPVAHIQREVYSRKDMTPDKGQRESYEVCRKAGYDNILSALKLADQQYNLAETEKIKKELAAKKLSSKKPVKKKNKSLKVE